MGNIRISQRIGDLVVTSDAGRDFFRMSLAKAIVDGIDSYESSINFSDSRHYQILKQLRDFLDWQKESIKKPITHILEQNQSGTMQLKDFKVLTSEIEFQEDIFTSKMDKVIYDILKENDAGISKTEKLIYDGDVLKYVTKKKKQQQESYYQKAQGYLSSKISEYENIQKLASNLDVLQAKCKELLSCIRLTEPKLRNAEVLKDEFDKFVKSSSLSIHEIERVELIHSEILVRTDDFKSLSLKSIQIWEVEELQEFISSVDELQANSKLLEDALDRFRVAVRRYDIKI